MAGDDHKDRDRRRNRSRKVAPVIEATARDVSPPAEAIVTQDPAAPLPTTVAEAIDVQPIKASEPAEVLRALVEPQPSVSPAEAAVEPQTSAPLAEPAPHVEARKPEASDIIAPPAPPAPPAEKPRLALPLAVAALVGALFGAGTGAVVPGLMSNAPPAVDGARIQRLEQGLAELARRPVPAPTPTPQASATSQIPQDLQDLPRRLASLEDQITVRLAQLDQKIAAVPAPSSASSAPAVDLMPLAEKVGALEKALATLDQKADAARTAANESIRAVTPQIQQLTTRLTATAQRVEVTAAAPLFSAAQALNQAFQRGAPFSAELAALEALGVKPEQIAALKDLAAKGAPTARQLSETFRPLAEQMTRATTPAATGLDAVWQSFVTSRPAGAGAPQAGLPGAVETALRAGDIPAALAAWAQLPEAARKASEAWAATARQREAADQVIRELNEAALAALRKAAP